MSWGRALSFPGERQHQGGEALFAQWMMGRILSRANLSPHPTGETSNRLERAPICGRRERALSCVHNTQAIWPCEGISSCIACMLEKTSHYTLHWQNASFSISRPASEKLTLPWPPGRNAGRALADLASMVLKGKLHEPDRFSSQKIITTAKLWTNLHL